jgi:hypothetical protein
MSYRPVNNVLDEKVNPAITRYNEAVSELESLRDDIVAEMESYVGDRSEKWQEGDCATTYEEWKSEWEARCVRVGYDRALELPDTPHAAELEGFCWTVVKVSMR